MSGSSRRTAPRCDLGVTGKRLRNALPAIPPPAPFRHALKLLISGQWSTVDGPAVIGADPPSAQPQPSASNP